jgi:hypothetical protein
MGSSAGHKAFASVEGNLFTMRGDARVHARLTASVGVEKDVSHGNGVDVVSADEERQQHVFSTRPAFRSPTRDEALVQHTLQSRTAEGAAPISTLPPRTTPVLQRIEPRRSAAAESAPHRRWVPVASLDQRFS